MILQTKHVILCSWNYDDAEELYKYASDHDLSLPAGWPPHTIISNSRQIIRTVLSDSEAYAVCLRQNGKAVGCVELHRNDIAEADDEYELGFWKNFIKAHGSNQKREHFGAE